MALLRLNAMRKFIANVKHHIYAHIYTDVNIITFYANIYNTFTAYVKVQTYLHTYLRHVCRASKCGIYLRTYLPYARTRFGLMCNAMFTPTFQHTLLR